MRIRRDMSGGSYNYLYMAADLGLLGERRDDLRAMIDRLAEIPGPEAAKAAAASLQVLTTLEQADHLAQALSDVWHAVEWRDSCDYSDDQVTRELARYARGET